MYLIHPNIWHWSLLNYIWTVFPYITYLVFPLNTFFSVPNFYHQALVVMVWPPVHSKSYISFLSFLPLSLLFHKRTEDDLSVGPHNLDVTYPICILGQVWYLFVSIPDLCTLTYICYSDEPIPRKASMAGQGWRPNMKLKGENPIL